MGRLTFVLKAMAREADVGLQNVFMGGGAFCM